MGLSTWSVFRAEINHTLIVELADSMVDLQLLEKGYTYFLMDAGWTAEKPNCPSCLSHRNETGHLYVDPTKFPNLKDTVDYVHQKGLLFGIWYGFEMCDDATFAKSTTNDDYAHHYATLDANFFASIGADALKHDICDAVVPNTTQGRQHNFEKFQAFGDALNATGRPMLYDVSLIVSKARETPAYDYNYVYSPEPYGQELVRSISNMWWSVPVNKYNCWKCCVHPQEFIVDDEEACNDPTKLPAWRGLLPILDIQDMKTPGWMGHWDWAGKAKGWNHLDQLSSCMGKSWYGPGLTPSEQVAQISLWAIMASPLIIPPDIRKIQIGEFCHFLIANPKMISVHQDLLGIPGRPVKSFYKDDDGTSKEIIIGQLWVRPLTGGAVAVVFFNRQEQPLRMEATWQELGLLSSSSNSTTTATTATTATTTTVVQGMNVWTDEIRQNISSPMMMVSVPPHAVSFWILTPKNTKEITKNDSSRIIRGSSQSRMKNIEGGTGTAGIVSR
ncbi:unnamed protein product [Cylindrotheca closterium]|uniref:alpha-galactosidase n=1 Tax=Cylindrotheca closterium TaxID=2856 RepID=A0AAD2CYR4_9STRA|nr:unnamed protein product [Cylindrotheca closterium]